LDPASAEVIAKREIKVTAKIIDNNFFPIGNPSFRGRSFNLHFFRRRGKELYSNSGNWNIGKLEE
jgi:hypothetical protein